MAEERTTTFHIHRRYNMKPLRRFAFTVEFDPTTPTNYRIVDHDPIVADAAYLTKFQDHMARPVRNARTGATYRGNVGITEISDLAPGSIDHYVNAVRRFRAAIMSTGRPR